MIFPTKLKDLYTITKQKISILNTVKSRIEEHFENMTGLILQPFIYSIFYYMAKTRNLFTKS